MSNEMMSKEMKEAMEAGECALSSLRIVQEKLKSASNGDGVISLEADFLQR